jgi:hypothetical protein
MEKKTDAFQYYDSHNDPLSSAGDLMAALT